MIKLVQNFLELSKIRMVPMVLVTAAYGYFLGNRGQFFYSDLFWLFLGMALVSAGSAALNNYQEKDYDALMPRTQNRVLPQGQILPSTALIYGVSSVITGVFILVWQVNLLTGFLLLLASFLYVLVYTPMKRWSTWNTFVGAIPGAIPPLAGWAAATGSIGLGGIVLFAILFTWQHPHFFAIALMYREDYQAGGFKMLPVVDEKGLRTSRQILVYSVLMILVSLLPTALGLTGPVYFVGALLAGLGFLFFGLWLVRNYDYGHAKKLFHSSLVYLPLIFVLILFDLGF